MADKIGTDEYGEILIYQTDDGQTNIEVKIEDDTVWLTQQQMSELFQTSRTNVVEHIKHIYEERELDEISTCRNFRQVRKEGNRNVTREIPFYNLDMIISLGYRIKSKIATNFRRWATERLKEYMIKGFTMDDERLKGNGGGNYWKELLARIKDIRSSEKVLYRQVLDLYAKGALGSKNTSIWEAGVNFTLDENIDLNAGYRYLNTEGSRDKNVSYQGWLAGVSYRFGGGSDRKAAYSEDDIDYSALDNKGNKKEADTVTITPAEEETAVPENDYYFNSIHFGNDSDTPRTDQTANLDAFVKAAKETGHTFKLVGRTDSNGSKEYNDDLAIRRVKKVADYAVAHGVDLSHLVGMYKGEEAPVDTNDTEAGRANNRRVDIFEHK